MKCGDDLVRFLIEVLQRTPHGITFTELHLDQLEQQLRANFGGQLVYVPKMDREARRLAILKEFNGRNRVELCAKYGVKKAQFYRILKGG